MPIAEGAKIYTPDDLMDGTIPEGRVVVYDDDHYYMGGALAALLAKNGAQVTLVTPSAYVSDWTNNTLEQIAIHPRLVEAGVEIVLNQGVTEIHPDHVVSNCTYTDRTWKIEADAVVMVASRVGNDRIFEDLMVRESDWADAGIKTVKLIGDANAPGPIAWATYAGHRFARELDTPDIGDDLPFRREITELAVD
jgi:dimethylamine/trimethylamine dehydrogenase